MSAKPTAQDILKKAGVLKAKVVSLASNTSDFQGSNVTVEKVLVVHNAALLVKQAIDDLTPDVVVGSNVERPVSVADGTQALKVLKEIQVSCNAISNEVITKKSLLDGLGAANLNTLAQQDLKEIHTAFIHLSNALVDIAPSELVEQAKATQKEYDELIKKTLVAYQ